MRIALLTRFSAPFHFHGGLQRYAADVAIHVSAAGAEVELFCEPPDHERAATEALPLASGAVHFVRHATIPGLGQRKGRVILDRISNYFLFSHAAAAAVLARHAEKPFDVVYAQGLAGWGIARRIGRAPGGVPALAVINQGMEEFKSTSATKHALYTPFRAGIRSASRRAALVVATDEAARAESERLLGFAPRAWAVVPVGTDLAHLASLRNEAMARRWRERLGVEADRPLVLSVSRLERNKGFHVAVEAFAAIREVLPAGWRWVVAGTGSQGAALERAAAEAGLGDHVQFVGQVSDPELHNLYPLADLFVHPTLFEGTSIVTQEAMAHGLPIVASAAGGIPEKIESGLSGVLVPPGDARALGEAIVRTLARADRGRALGDAARAAVHARFAWPAVAARLLAAFEPLGAKRPGS